MTKSIRLTGFLVSALLLGVLTTQCRQPEVALAPNIEKLIGTWRLVEPDSAYAVTLTFALDTDNPPHDVTSFKVNGKSAVNTYSLRMIAAIDGMLSADNLVTTEIAGGDQVMAFEKNYFRGLNGTVRYDFTPENRLRLYYGGSQPGVLIYQK